MADAMQLYKYVVRNVARKAGKVATFMPKPIFEENGSGMHTHMSLWKNGETVMYDPDGYGLLSHTARHYVGGLLAHAPALLAFCAPTTNSYKRLVPGYEAPVSLLYSQRNRSAAVRIPVSSPRRRPNASSFARRIPARTRTSRSPRCSWRGWTVFGVRSSRPSRSTRTSTRSPRRAPGADRPTADVPGSRARRAGGRP